MDKKCSECGKSLMEESKDVLEEFCDKCFQELELIIDDHYYENVVRPQLHVFSELSQAFNE